MPLKRLIYKNKESKRENSRNSIEKPSLDCENPVLWKQNKCKKHEETLQLPTRDDRKIEEVLIEDKTDEKKKI